MNRPARRHLMRKDNHGRREGQALTWESPGRRTAAPPGRRPLRPRGPQRGAAAPAAGTGGGCPPARPGAAGCRAVTATAALMRRDATATWHQLSRNPVHVTLCNYDAPACYEPDRVRPAGPVPPEQLERPSRRGRRRAAVIRRCIRRVRAGPPPAVGLVRVAGSSGQTDQAGCGRSHGGASRPHPLALSPTGVRLRVPAWFVKLSSVSCVHPMIPAGPGEIMSRLPLPGLVVMHARDGGTGR